jgi:hypothetical protein
MKLTPDFTDPKLSPAVSAQNPTVWPVLLSPVTWVWNEPGKFSLV